MVAAPLTGLRAEAARKAQWVIDTQFLAQCLGGVSKPVADLAREAAVRVPVGATHVRGLAPDRETVRTETSSPE